MLFSFYTPLWKRQLLTSRGIDRSGNQVLAWLRSSYRFQGKAGYPLKSFQTVQGVTGVNNMTKIIAIEGNIGVGKTTLAYKLGEELGYQVFVEPTAKNPYLAKFYADPRKYATKLQLWIFKQRFLIYAEALKHFFSTGQGIILDRSVFSDEVFAHVGHNLGNISDEGFAIYTKIRKDALNSLLPPHLFLYLDASPQVCLKRIKSRGRIYEKGITIQYLTMLDEMYQNFRYNIKLSGIPELCFDWSNIFSAEMVAKDIICMPAYSNGTALEKYKNYMTTFTPKNVLSSFINELESELSEDEEDCNDMQMAEKKAFTQENISYHS